MSVFEIKEEDPFEIEKKGRMTVMTQYFRSFSVVPPCEAFASLFSYARSDYRQKNPLKYCALTVIVLNYGSH